MMSATIQQHRRTGIGNGAVTLTVTGVDNEVTIALNGVELAQLTGPGGFSGHTENLAGHLRSGEPNVLVLTLANYHGGGFNPWSCAATLHVNGEEINLSASGNDVHNGVRAQSIVILEK